MRWALRMMVSPCTERTGWLALVGFFKTDEKLGGLGRPQSCIHSADEHTTKQDIIALAKSILAYLAQDFASDDIPEQNTTTTIEGN